MKGKRLLSLLLVAGITIGSLGGCGKKENESVNKLIIDGKEVAVEGYLFQSGDYGITLDEYRYYFLSMRNTLEFGSTEEEIATLWTDEMQTALKKQAQTYALSALALRKLADDYGIEITEEDEAAFQKELADRQAEYGDTFQADFMDANYYTMDVYRELFYDTVRYRKLYHLLYDEGGQAEISDDAVRAYYDNNYFYAKQIFLMPDGEDSTENYDLAQSLRARIANGEDFETLQAEYNMDPYQSNFPNGYTYTADDMVDGFYDETADLMVGEVSHVFETESGIHIVKRYPLREDYYEENKPNIYNQAAEEDINDRRRETMHELLDNITYQDIYEKITVNTLR